MLATSNFCHTSGRKEFIWIHKVVLNEKKMHILLGYLSAADKDYSDFCESWWEPLIICLTCIDIETPNAISSILTRWKFCLREHVWLGSACCFWVDSILGLEFSAPGGTSEWMNQKSLLQPAGSVNSGVSFCGLGSCCNNKIFLLIHGLQILVNSLMYCSRNTKGHL